MPGSQTPTSTPASPAGTCGCLQPSPHSMKTCALGHPWDPAPVPAPHLASSHQCFIWEHVDEQGRISPFPAALLLCQCRTLRVLLLLQPRSSSHTPFTARAVCVSWAKAVQSQAQPALGTWVSQKPPKFPLLKRSRFCTKSRFSRQYQNPAPTQTPSQVRIAALFLLYTPKQASAAFVLLLLSTHHPVSPPKGEREGLFAAP